MNDLLVKAPKKTRGYRVRVASNRLVVEHRTPLGASTIPVLCVGLAIPLFFPDTRRNFTDFCHSPNLGSGLLFLFFLLAPLIMTGWSWFLFRSGEAMLCDTQQLQLSRRRLWGRWERRSFETARIRQLQSSMRGTSKTRSYTVLTFQYGYESCDMLEDLGAIKTAEVLNACKALGLDVLIPPDPGVAMLKDIDERGWFVNPLKPS